ncbi:MMPL family transporter [Streptomyces lunaelactis]|uniref:MMPL family transporter n=1 Tax=Streptomyces lunaelactis TaxID=1535768 RepID=UPI0015845A2F|nr:MMPL family transporter [Streptomyces lunaelactis]NUK04802.1 MMPL family transporter [Streptomyces lunaelactis]NUK19238.1 MMPL family transporter [Streptomyces lunaelactis]
MGPENRRRRAVPWVVLAFWIAVIALAAPFAGKLGDVQRDNVVDYLPADADSTQVAKIQQELPGGEATELVLVYHRDGGLTAADRGLAERQVGAVAGAHQLTGGQRPVAVPSEDGTTLMFPVATLEPGADEEARTAFVDEVRETARGTRGLSVEVGGPSALQTDMGKVFDSIDGTLMIATVLVVAVLLILTYRSPFLWLVPLLVVGVAALTTRAVIYGLVQGFGLTVTSQSAGIMTVLVFGAGTDYALLLVARYREELRRVPLPYDAMSAALRGCGPAVLASSGTVAAGLLCLLAADLNSARGLGPVGALGVVGALAAMLSLLPAVLVLLGRRVFWPLIPAYGSEPGQRRSLFAAMGGSAGRRPVAVLASGAVLLGALALGAFGLPGTLKQEDSFTDRPDSVSAMRTLADAYPERSSQPIGVVTRTDGAEAVLAKARTTKGVAGAERGRSADGWTELAVFAKDAPETAGETATIKALRAGLDGSYVGGPSAQQLDLDDTSARDRLIVIPLVLAAVLLILIALLRSLVAPLMLVVAVVAVWGAAMGLGGLLFESVFGFSGVDPGLPLLSFVFLVALGVDYGIFLMHRMREESLSGAESSAAALTALRTTGGVIASAGIVLAATFAVLMNLPLVAMVELGFVVAVGVLLDTFLVRTYLVTSASVVLGRRVWWPGGLSRGVPDPAPQTPARLDVPAAAGTSSLAGD